MLHKQSHFELVPSHTPSPTGSRAGSESRRKSSAQVRGFSLIELLIVLAVALIAAAMAFMNMQAAMRTGRLRTSANNYANLLQQARIRAVQDDRYYTVLTTTNAAGIPFAYIDIAGTQTFATGDPMAVLSQSVTPQPFNSGPARASLMALFLPAGTSGTVDPTAPGPTFGPRGLPCKPVTNSGYTTCPYLQPTSFITFLQNQQGGAWEAITVTPAGRIRMWAYSNTWSPLN